MRPEDWDRLRRWVDSDDPPDDETRAWLGEVVRRCSKLGTADCALAVIEARIVLSRAPAPSLEVVP